MASPYGVDTISTISRIHVMPNFIDQVYKSNPVFFRLYKSGRVTLQGGLQIEQPLLTSRLASGGSYKGYDVLDVSPSDTIKSAAWDWRQYFTNVTVDGLTLIKVNTPEAIADYVQTYFQQARMDLSAILAFDMWNNAPGASSGQADPKGLDGLRFAVDDGTSTPNVYGGIDRSANAFWKAQVDSTANAAMSLVNLNAFHGRCIRGGYGPTIVASRRDQYNTYWSKVASTNLTVQQPLMTAVQDEQLAQMGFTNLYFNNIPWVVDDYVNDGSASNSNPTTHSSIYFLNEEFLKFVVHQDRNMDLGDFKEGINQDAMVSLIKFAGNIVSQNSNTHGVMTGITS